MDSAELGQRASMVIKTHNERRPCKGKPDSLRLTPRRRTGHNIPYDAQGDDGRNYFVKFCRDDTGRVPDICEREVLVSLLGQWLEVPVVEAWSTPATVVTVEDLPAEDGLILAKCVVMPLLDASTVRLSTAEATKIAQAGPEQVADLLAFMHWVGDEDRGLDDVMLVGKQLILIDNGLCGPGRDAVLRGAHPNPGVYHGNHEALVKKCYPGKGSLVAFLLRDSRISARELAKPRVIDWIENLPEEAVENIVEAAGLPSWIGDVLILRQQLLRCSYLEWLSRAVQVCSPR